MSTSSIDLPPDWHEIDSMGRWRDAVAALRERHLGETEPRRPEPPGARLGEGPAARGEWAAGPPSG